jgi:hypothetical protein
MNQEVTLTDLVPNATYLVSVTALSALVQVGSGEGGRGSVQASNVTATTLGEPSGPSALRVSYNGPDFVVVMWDYEWTSPGNSVTHFRLYFNATGKGHGSRLAAGQRRRTFVLSGSLPPEGGGMMCGGLLPSTEYLVSVAACGPGGCSGENGLFVWTAPYPPLNFSVKSIKTSPAISIWLRWSAPCAVTLDASAAYPEKIIERASHPTGNPVVHPSDADGNPMPECPSSVLSELDIRYTLSLRKKVTGSAFGAWTPEVYSGSNGALREIEMSFSAGDQPLAMGSEYHARLVAVFQAMRSEPVFIQETIFLPKI